MDRDDLTVTSNFDIKDSSLGVMVVLTNSTEMLKYLNPNGKIACNPNEIDVKFQLDINFGGNYSGNSNYDPNKNQVSR
ncbi:12141_t:CDS:2 [Entrophospora sp. SA101]|nr:12141_t:CDS:2 [Entrophospora sp. SA101]